ncbi:MAG: hypothetical protein L0154_10010 [Chloroflexi bacterium]|nr:hypothetical protein [Chloroflexota bacterium]
MYMFDVTEDLGHGIMRHRIADNRIVIYSTHATTRASVDTWTRAVLDDAANWQGGSPYLIAHNFQKIAITPYSRQKAQEVCRSYDRNLTGRFALVLNRGPVGFTFQIYTQRVLAGMVPRGLEPGFFYNLDAAIRWLKERLPDETHT